MDVLKFLKSIRAKRNELNTLVETRDTLRATLMPSGIRYDLDRVQTSPSDRMLEVNVDLYEINITIENRMNLLIRDIQLATHVIDQIEPSELRTLLWLRYISGDRPTTWEDVAKEMNYSVQHVKEYMHEKAISEARIIWRNLNTH